MYELQESYWHISLLFCASLQRVAEHFLLFEYKHTLRGAVLQEQLTD
jgi:hypothetical protein